MKTHTIESITEIEAVICRCKVCFVGITDADGSPYVIPMNFGYSAGIFYLHSGPHGNKLKQLARDPRVCITLSVGEELVAQTESVACSYSMRGDSVVCRGNVQFITSDEEKRKALDIIMKQYTHDTFTYNDPAVRNVVVWRVEPTSLSCKLFGNKPQRYAR